MIFEKKTIYCLPLHDAVADFLKVLSYMLLNLGLQIIMNDLLPSSRSRRVCNCSAVITIVIKTRSVITIAIFKWRKSY